MLVKNYFSLTLRSLCLIYISMFITNCGNKSDLPDVSEMTLTVKAERFEKDLFAIDPMDPGAGINLLKDKYGNFYDLFIHRITSIGARDSLQTRDHLVAFVSDSDFNAVYHDCERLFDDFSPVDNEFTKAFRNYSYYFPGKKIPRIVTMISGFSYPVVCDSNNLGVSLDMYLGPSYRYYSTLEPPLPNYLRSRMHRNYIVSDAMKGWAASDYGIDESTARMIDFMISHGRLLYFLDKVVPTAHDTIKTGYSLPQFEWCLMNEKNLWKFFIENKLLFSFDPNLLNKYVNDGPTTNGMPKESPGNIGQFIGWQIVKSYMANHKEITLEQLMNEKSMQKIYDESKYKPTK